MTLRLIKNEPRVLGVAEYIWVDAGGTLLSKTRTVTSAQDDGSELVPIIEKWTYSAPHQLGHRNTQYILSPCHYLADPLRPQPSFIVLCEVRDQNDCTVAFNKRSVLRRALDTEGNKLGLWWGFRQQYGLVGNPNECHKVAERHFGACLDAALYVHSFRQDTDGTWEFKIGPRQTPKEIDPLEPSAEAMADHLWIARHLLVRIGQEAGVNVAFLRQHRCSVFFSSEAMRSLGVTEPLLSGLRSYLGIEESDRSALIPRISVPDRLRTFIEDRRGRGNADPYELAGDLMNVFLPSNEGDTCESENPKESGDCRSLDRCREKHPDEGTGQGSGADDPDPDRA